MILFAYFGEGQPSRPGQVVWRQIQAMVTGKGTKAYHRFKGMQIVLQNVMEGYSKMMVQFFEFCILQHYNLDYLANSIHDSNPFNQAAWAQIPDGRRSADYFDFGHR